MRYESMFAFDSMSDEQKTALHALTWRHAGIDKGRKSMA